MSNALHSTMDVDDNHIAHSLSFADETARLAFGASPEDVGRIAIQVDDNSFWILRDDDPLTWLRMDNADVHAHSNKTEIDKITDGDHDVRSDNPHAVTKVQVGLGNTPDGATINDTDANLKARANHTGTQAASTVSDFSTAADARIDAKRGAVNGVASLDGGGKVPTSELPDSITGQIEYKGTWDADTNDPTIPAASSANKGHYYKVSVAGNTNIDGITDWKIGDWIVSNGTTWDKIDNTESVSSVAGKTGAVTLVEADITDLHAHSNKSEIDLVTDGDHDVRSDNPHTVTKAQAGLGNCDNTTDAGKPVSTAQQTALDGKSATGHGHTESDISDLHAHSNKAQIDLITDGDHDVRSDNPHTVTKAQVGLTDVPDLKCKLDATTTPTINDDSSAGYAVGSRWFDVTADKIYECIDSTDTAAIWIEISDNGATHAALTDNPHAVTQAQAGLGNCDNTADADKPVSTATQTALDGKSATGHGHTESDISDLHAHANKAQIDLITDGDHDVRSDNPHTVTKAQAGLGNCDNTADADKPVSTATQTALDGKSGTGHGHTASDVSDFDTAADARIAAKRGATNGIASLDGGGKVPTSELPDSIIGQIEYKGTWDADTNDPTIPAASSANKGHYYKVSVAGNTNIDGITDWKIGDWIVSNGTTWDKIDNTESVSSVAGKTGAVTLVEADITDLHAHSNKAQVDLITDGDHDVRSDNPHTVTKAQAGLGNCDNTTDAGKPVSTAQQTALDGKSATGHGHTESDISDLHAHSNKAQIDLITDGNHDVIASGNPHSVTKAEVGLGNCDNTTDAGKPVSTAQQTALDGKSATGHGHTESDISDLHAHSNKAQIDLITDGDHDVRTDNPHTVTKAQVGLTNVTDIKCKLDATVAPTVNDDSGSGYSVGSRWFDVTADKEYVCLDATSTAAVWIETTQSGGGGSQTKEHFFMVDGDADDDDYRIKSVGTNGSFNMSFHFPLDFDSLSELVIVGIPASGIDGSGKDIDLFSDYAALGEAKATHSESDTTTVYDFTGKAGKICEIDISGLFGSVNAGDYAGIKVEHNAVGGTMNYLGLRMKYTT